MRKILDTLLAVGLAVAAVGCSGGTTQATPLESKSFKGGPMPPEAQRHMQEALGNAQRGAQTAAANAAQEAARKAQQGG